MTDKSSPAIPHYAAGAEEFRKGEFEKAVAHLRKAVEADPNFYRAHAYLGMALDRVGKIDEAIEAYRECIDIAPDYHKAFNNVGELYRRKGLLDYASMVFKMATEISPHHAPYFYNLGITYMDIGMMPQAETALSRAFELEPERLETATDLAQVRFTLEDFRGALDVLERFLLEAPDHDRAAEIRARTNLLRRKIVEESAGGEPHADPVLAPDTKILGKVEENIEEATRPMEKDASPQEGEARTEAQKATRPLEMNAAVEEEEVRSEDDTRPLPKVEDHEGGGA